MAGNGRKAAGNGGTELDVLRSTGQVIGPELPEGVLPDGEEWHPMTVRWWENWRRSPQASKMLSDPDWDFLLDTALIHTVMWRKGRWEFANEVRMRVQQFGATPAARRQLKAEIETAEESPVGNADAQVTDIRSRRIRITGG